MDIFSKKSFFRILLCFLFLFPIVGEAGILKSGIKSVVIGKVVKKALIKRAAKKTVANRVENSVGLINGRKPLYSHMAGKVHNGVPYKKDGFPDFKKFMTHEIDIKVTGNRQKDFAIANSRFGFKETPAGYTWHHHENGRTMQLVEKAAHKAAPHSGGISRYKENLALQKAADTRISAKGRVFKKIFNKK